jgi:hypothetical protein
MVMVMGRWVVWIACDTVYGMGMVLKRRPAGTLWLFFGYHRNTNERRLSVDSINLHLFPLPF